jgi:microcystin-dependent protein
MTLYKWLQASGSNANVDSTINWAEGQAPSTINDSARGMMAAIAKYRDDIAGAIVTTGTSTAYAVSSYEVFDTLAHLNGQVIAFTPHVTNGATVTLNVDSLGAKPLRTAPNTELLAGTIIQGTPYVAAYNNSDGAFYLRGFYGASPYLIPLGGMIDYTGATTPNSNFVLPFGQAISRTTYASYFSMVSTTFGTGDGSTTFNVPDLRGRVIAGKDDMGGSAASRLTSSGSSITGTTIGATGGAETVSLAANQIPAGVPSTGSISSGAANSSNGNIPAMNNTIQDFAANISGGGTVHVPAFIGAGGSWSNNSTLTVTGTPNVTSTNASQAAVNKMPPTIVLNKILRVL